MIFRGPAIDAASAAPTCGFDCGHAGAAVSDLIEGGIGLGLIALALGIVTRIHRSLASTPASDTPRPTVTAISEKYECKLKQWLASATLIATTTVLGICATWFIKFSETYRLIGKISFADHMAMPIAIILVLYLITFVPTFLWHVADFFELKRPNGPILRKATSYPFFFAFLFGLSLCTLLDSTGWFTVTFRCGGRFLMLTQACIGPSPVLATPQFVLFWSVPLIVILKLAVSLTSRLRRAQ